MLMKHKKGGEQQTWNYYLKNNRTITVKYHRKRLFPCADIFFLREKRTFYNDRPSIFININK